MISGIFQRNEAAIDESAELVYTILKSITEKAGTAPDYRPPPYREYSLRYGAAVTGLPVLCGNMAANFREVRRNRP